MHLLLLGEWNPPEQVIRTRDKTFKVYGSHRCEGNISGKLARNFSTFLRFLEATFFRKSLVKS